MELYALTDSDYRKLSALALAMRNSRNPGRAAVLDQRLRIARGAGSADSAGIQVTMNSRITIRDEDSGEVFSYRLAFPAEADISTGRISVLTPLGSELLGRRAGESFGYDSPGGRRRVLVEKVVQDD